MHCCMLSFLCLPGHWQWTGGRKCGCVKMSTHSTPHRSYQSKQSSYCILEHLEIAFQPWKPVSKLKPQLALSPVGKGWNRILYIHGHRVALWPGGDQHSNPPPPTQTLWKSHHLAAIGSCPLRCSSLNLLVYEHSLLYGDRQVIKGDLVNHTPTRDLRLPGQVEKSSKTTRSSYGISLSLYGLGAVIGENLQRWHLSTKSLPRSQSSWEQSLHLQLQM